MANKKKTPRQIIEEFKLKYKNERLNGYRRNDPRVQKYFKELDSLLPTDKLSQKEKKEIESLKDEAVQFSKNWDRNNVVTLKNDAATLEKMSSVNKSSNSGKVLKSPEQKASIARDSIAKEVRRKEIAKAESEKKDKEKIEKERLVKIEKEKEAGRAYWRRKANKELADKNQKEQLEKDNLKNDLRAKAFGKSEDNKNEVAMNSANKYDPKKQHYDASNPTKGMHDSLVEFRSELERRFPELKYTSGFRDGDSGRHGSGEAWDIEPNKKVFDYLNGTTEGLKLMTKHGVGFLDESTPDKFTKNATGAHYHIGKDSKLAERAKTKYKEVVERERSTLKDQFVESLGIGLGATESNNRYNAQNPDSTAIGKFQFTEEWLDKPKHGIQQFAKDSKGVFKVPESMEDFKADPGLQDAYFKYYAKDILFPLAEKAFKGPNPANLSLVEVGALFHYKPPYTDQKGNRGAFEQVKTGKLDEATPTNMSVAKYLTGFNGSLKSNGVAPISNKLLSNADVITPDKNKNALEDFKKRTQALNDNQYISDDQREVKRGELFQEVVDAGNTELINEYLKSENEANKQKFEALQNLEKVFQGAEAKGRESLNKSGGYDVTHNEIQTQWGSGDAKKMLEDFPELNQFFNLESKGDKTRMVIKPSWKNAHSKNTVPNFEKELNNIFSEAYGKDAVKIKFENDRSTDVFSNTLRKIPLSIASSLPRQDAFKIENSSDVSEPKTVSLIDPQIYKPKVKERISEKDTASEAKAKEAAKTPEEKAVEETPVPVTDTTSADEYFTNRLEAYSVNKDKPTYGQTKGEVPIDAIMGLTLGLIGNKQAKDAKIPLRTEEVSQAMKSYMAELGERSKKGLPPEVMAKMTNQLAEAYQGGLENIANSSGGNRALVLGNQGALENAKSKGLTDISIADFEAKDRAFQAYGKALEYENDFNARRDIANHGIEYSEAMRTKMKGEALAEGGFAKMIDGIKYAKENGPGSANAMYKSYLMQNMFGHDPNMVDNGLGDTPGTKSFYDKQEMEYGQKQLNTIESDSKYQSLSTDKKGLVNEFIKNNKNQSDIDGFVDYMKNSTGLDTKGFSLDKMEDATKNKNFGLLFDRNSALTEQAPVEVNKSPDSDFIKPLFGTAEIVKEIPQGIEDYNSTYNIA